MNLREGCKRIFLIVSLVPIGIGICMFITGLVDEDGDLCLGAFFVGIGGFILIWVVYMCILYIARGFKICKCANCEKNIGKLEERFVFKKHTVCSACNNKLNEKN